MLKSWIFLAFLSVGCICSLAQVSEKKLNLVSIKATGSKTFTEAEIVAASGLHLNTEIDQQTLLDASNRLIATGVFETVVYQFAPDTANNVTVTFQLADNNKTLPVIFENFVWFSRDQLNTKLHERLPLYRERMPLAGAIHDQIKDVLQDMLNANSIKGQVSFRLHQPSENAPLDGVAYKIEGISVRVASLSFEGVSSANLPALQEASKRLLATSYEEDSVRGFCAETLRPLYLARGYLKVNCDDPKIQIASQNDQQAALNLTLPLQEGPQYKFVGASWTGNAAFVSADLQKFILLKNGEAANAIKLHQNLATIKTFYETHGYVRMTYKLQAQLQQDNTASFDVQVQEGDQYRMGEFQVRGIDPDRAAKMQKSWKLATGAVYDASYMQQFIKDISRFVPLEHSRVRARTNINDQNKSVDVLIEISSAG